MYFRNECGYKILEGIIVVVVVVVMVVVVVVAGEGIDKNQVTFDEIVLTIIVIMISNLFSFPKTYLRR